MCVRPVVPVVPVVLEHIPWIEYRPRFRCASSRLRNVASVVARKHPGMLEAGGIAGRSLSSIDFSVKFQRTNLPHRAPCLLDVVTLSAHSV